MDELLCIAKPILFNTEMVRAILNGEKTVTRRLPSKRTEEKYLDYEERVGVVAPPGSVALTEKQFHEQYPPYQPGDYLYVRETWGDYRECEDGGCGYFMYRADYPNGASTYKFDGHICDLPKWHPSIHMPKEAARIFLRVTDVRMERLQDITDDQAEKEGCTDYTSTALGFFDIWDSTIKKSDLNRHGWTANPWVWVIEFERVMSDEIQ